MGRADYVERVICAASAQGSLGRRAVAGNLPTSWVDDQVYAQPPPREVQERASATCLILCQADYFVSLPDPAPLS